MSWNMDQILSMDQTESKYCMDQGQDKVCNHDIVQHMLSEQKQLFHLWQLMLWYKKLEDLCFCIRNNFCLKYRLEVIMLHI